ncbi:hypothetical protein [Marinifilum caeruleilacunae]|uniref:Helix-turn-helix domain-containing protein n=1 Tax=Marinifilum caeruleilacunae TaxID=2499076 RepID=A0ABX1X1X2_9BACT|nr:hypothetical protein [Marinifilum caeruleilacunae]NOU62226.1 hypothetical protein [Marinifilum caeruleilacunae]
MEFYTMTRKEFAVKMKVSRSTLYRYMNACLAPEFLELTKGKLLFKEQVEFIYNKIIASEKWKKLMDSKLEIEKY